MKRIILKCVLFGLIALCPLGFSLLLHFGYTLTLFSGPAFAIIIAALSFCVVVLDFIYKDTIPNKIICILMGVVAPLSLINVFFYILEYAQVSVLVSGAICFVCCCILTAKHARPMALKIVALVLSALMVLPIGFASLIVVFFPIGQNTVVQTVESPSGRYYAEVIDSDQGALGGDTLVNVYEKWEMNLLLFKIKKEPQQVYFGEWGEFKDMEIYWKNDSCIVINSVEYEIE
jgi:hypothetical protein